MTFAELIDLELTLYRDRSLPAEALWERDGRIARDIGAVELSDPALLVEWVRWVRAGGGSVGDRVVRGHRLAGRLTAGIGALLGTSGVAGWLAMSDRLPVNVVNFWPLIVGIPLLLLLGWGVLALGGAASAGGITQSVARASSRFAGERDRLAEDWRALESVGDRLGRLPFWLASRISHGFALAFQSGALAALLFLPIVDDPAFGWRSRILDEADVSRTAEVVAVPWRTFWPAALPTADVVASTRYSSVTPQLERGGAAPWAAWWPFLLASIAFYGILPRAFAWAWAAWASRRSIERAFASDDPDRRRLLARLRAPRVETRAEGVEPAGVEVTVGELGHAEPDWRTLRCGLFDFGGVAAERAPALAGALGAEPVGTWVVGGEDVAQEDLALEAAGQAGIEAAIVAVAPWDPPVGDHEEWLASVVGRLGPIPIGIWFAASAEVEPRHRTVWEEWIARRRDAEVFLVASQPGSAA